MSTKNKSGWGPGPFMDAAYGEQLAVEHECFVTLQVELQPMSQRGVYNVRVTSQPYFEQDMHLRHSVARSWPNEHAQSFEACLYQVVYRVCRMVEEASELAAKQAGQVTQRG